MSKTATVRARIEPQLKAEVERLFHELGLTTTEAITLFYWQVRLCNGRPFEVVVPNRATVKAFNQTDAKKGLVRCEDTGDRGSDAEADVHQAIQRMLRRGKGPAEIKKVIEVLVGGGRLRDRYRDHKLVGRFKDRRECHIEADWLLIYKTSQEEIVFERTGTHSDLFE